MSTLNPFAFRLSTQQQTSALLCHIIILSPVRVRPIRVPRHHFLRDPRPSLPTSNPLHAQTCTLVPVPVFTVQRVFIIIPFFLLAVWQRHCGTQWWKLIQWTVSQWTKTTHTKKPQHVRIAPCASLPWSLLSLLLLLLYIYEHAFLVLVLVFINPYQAGGVLFCYGCIYSSPLVRCARLADLIKCLHYPFNFLTTHFSCLCASPSIFTLLACTALKRKCHNLPSVFVLALFPPRGSSLFSQQIIFTLLKQ